MDISVAIVSYNSSLMLYESVRSILDFAGDIEYEIIIVDNNSSDDSVESIKDSFPDVLVIENNNNLGFSKAVNQAFKASSGDYFFLLNPDAKLISIIFPGMLAFFRSHPEAGIIAPRIAFPDNSLHLSARRFITLFGAVLDVLQIHFYFPKNIVAKRFNYGNWKHDTIREVDWVTGAALMTKRETFLDCGMLDERFFMYFEDMDHCMSVRKKGYTIYFCPQFSVVHHHAKGGSDKLPVRNVDYYISLNRYLYKHKGLLKAIFFRISMLSWGLTYLLVRTAKYFISRQNQSFRERINTPHKLIFNKSYEA